MLRSLSAINGTVGLLKAVKNNAPSVKQVVVTSSGAAILDFSKPKTYTFTEVFLHPWILAGNLS